MDSNTSSQSTWPGATRRTTCFDLGKTSVPKSFSRPAGNSMYMTGFFVSSLASVPCSGVSIPNWAPDCISITAYNGVRP
eukprot:365253-Chlamydomonas_euryale.AAC.19